MRRPRALLAVWVVGAILWMILPVATYVYLTSTTNAQTMTPKVDVWAPVQSNDGPSRTKLSIVVQRSPESSIFAPAWTGIVEATNITAGATIQSGSIIATVSGIDRYAYASERPFSSILSREDESNSVATLNQFLRNAGLDAPDSDYFGYATLSAVREFADSIGVPDGDEVQSFDPTWIVFLPEESVTIGESFMFVGAPAPVAGEPIAKTRPTINAALLDAATEPSGQGEDSVVAVVNPVLAPGDSTLEIGTTALPISADRAGVDPTAFAQLASLVAPEQSRVEASLVLPVPQGDWVIPSQSIATDSSGVTCVWAREGADDSSRQVSVFTSDLGRTYVSGDLSEDSEVLVTSRQGQIEC